MKPTRQFPYISQDIFILLLIALLKFVFHLIFANIYGYFRDELYYIACSKNLDWGYVDHPPFAPFLLSISRTLFGESLIAIRLFPAAAVSIVVFISGLCAREMGGNRFSQIMTAVLVSLSPVLAAMGGFYSMNPLDHLFWTSLIYLYIRIIKTGNNKLWILFGALAGLGLQNKISVLFLLFGLAVGIVLTGKFFANIKNKYIWYGKAVAGLIFLPHIIWQIAYDFPTLEFMHNAGAYKNAPLSPIEFILGHIMDSGPFYFPVMLAGLWFFLFTKQGKPFKVFGWTYLSLLVLFILTKSKTYYFAPVYPIIFAGGSVLIGRAIGEKKYVLKYALTIFIILAGLISLPMAVPVLPVEAFIKYAEVLGEKPQAAERKEMGKLPQLFADMFGWEDLAHKTANVYNSLSSEEKDKCGIYTQNYGEAGAIDFFGMKYNLPPAISGHNNYWLWGPRGNKGEIMIIIGGEREDHLKVYESVTEMERTNNIYAMPYENNMPLYLCRGLNVPISDVWPRTRHYD